MVAHGDFRREQVVRWQLGGIVVTHDCGRGLLTARVVQRDEADVGGKGDLLGDPALYFARPITRRRELGRGHVVREPQAQRTSGAEGELDYTPLECSAPAPERQLRQKAVVRVTTVLIERAVDQVPARQHGTERNERRLLVGNPRDVVQRGPLRRQVLRLVGQLFGKILDETPVREASKLTPRATAWSSAACKSGTRT